MAQENVVSTIDPARIRRVHLLGVCGTGMGSFAGMLAAQGFEVTGSDENIYPPMSDMLKAWGIRTMLGFSPKNLDAARPDLVIVGNVIRQVNPEATAVRERGLAHTSFPAALGELCIGSRHGVVVAGTHGKTTTSALMGHVLTHAGRDPSFLVGGVAHNYSGSFRIGRGVHFVVEGDEYDTAYFDKGPKFLHYRPRTAIITSLELDHADIYTDLAHYRSAFERFVALLPKDGYLAVCATWPDLLDVGRAARCRAESYSASEQAFWQATRITHGARATSFDVLMQGEAQGRLALKLPGAHNVENALGVVAACTALGLTMDDIAGGFSTFQGVRRRQEVRGEPGGVLVVDDFAHHPTAVRATIAAVAARSPGRPLWALFEPRSNTSRRSLHHEAYARAFEGASRAIIARPKPTDRVPEAERLDVDRLARDIEATGVPALALGSAEEIVETVRREAKPGDLVLVMSNGAFDDVVEKLLWALEQRA